MKVFLDDIRSIYYNINFINLQQHYVNHIIFIWTKGDFI